jgi:hypothetical protein
VNEVLVRILAEIEAERTRRARDLVSGANRDLEPSIAFSEGVGVDAGLAHAARIIRDFLQEEEASERERNQPIQFTG